MTSHSATLVSTHESSGRSVERYLWWFLLAHCLFWTLLPVLFHPNAPLDVVEDISWGREWQMGYAKHPPLAAWLANLAYLASGGRLWTIFLLSQIAVAAGWWAVWRVARDVVDEVSALACVVLLEGVTYCNITSPEFNPNVLELALWPLIVLFAWRALAQTERASAGGSGGDKHLGVWILLGAFAGLGLLAKYYTALLLLALLVFFIADSGARKAFRTAGPYASVFTALAVFFPHLLWMIKNGFVTVHYAVERAQAKPTFFSRITYPVGFAGAQLLTIAPMLVGLAILYRFWHATARPGRDSRGRFIAAVALGPFILTVIGSAVLDWKALSMWGTPLWSFLPLFLLVNKKESNAALNPRKVTIVGATIMAVLGVAFALSLVAEPFVYKKPRKALFPGQELAKRMTNAWTGRTGRPLRYVVGDTWLAGNVAFYSPDRPSTLTDADTALSPWVNLEILQQEGAVIVWDDPKMPAAYASEFPKAQEQPNLALNWQTTARVPAAIVHWAIVPPSSR